MAFKFWNKTAKTACILGALTVVGVAPQLNPSAIAKAKGPNPSVVAEGFVAGAPNMARGEFNLRSKGQVWLVHVHKGVSLKGVRGGDRVRVFGRPVGRTLTDANVRVIQSRGSDNPADYAPAQGAVG